MIIIGHKNSDGETTLISKEVTVREVDGRLLDRRGICWAFRIDGEWV